jgi:hypothetical protein
VTQDETGRILSTISEVYPSFRKDRNIRATQAVWARIFANTPYSQVEQALLSYIATDAKGFPPVPGALNERIHQARELAGLNENEAWMLVLRAISRGIYNSAEEFEKLPEDIRRIVGAPRQLYEWAFLDSHEVNTVIASNFKRSWRARKEAEKLLGPAFPPAFPEAETRSLPQPPDDEQK